MFQENISLKDYNTYRVGGNARYFFEAHDKESLKKAIKMAQEKSLPYFIIGSGTNILVPEEGFEGAIIKVGNYSSIISGTEVYADAGISMGALVQQSAKHSLSGLEWASGLPGTLGGAIFGNAGSHGKEIKDVISEVEVLDPLTHTIKKYSVSDCEFGYRHSAFKKNNTVIVGATLKMNAGDAAEINNHIKENIKKRLLSQPLAQRSAGCVFKNIEITTSHEARGLTHAHSDFIVYKDARFLPAGLLIDKAGLKGARKGGAMISDMHANFIINENNATADDIVGLIAIAKSAVQEKFGVALNEEIRILKKENK